jgi:hypothetical protein
MYEERGGWRSAIASLAHYSLHNTLIFDAHVSKNSPGLHTLGSLRRVMGLLLCIMGLLLFCESSALLAGRL